MFIFHEIQMPVFRYCVTLVTWLGMLVVLYVLYADVTLTRSKVKVKVKVTEHLNLLQLPITAHFQVYLLRHFRVELKTDGWWW